MLDLSITYTNFLIFILIIATNAQAKPPTGTYQCFHKATMHNWINFLENCPNQIKIKPDEFTFRIPALQSGECKIITKTDTLNFIQNALDKLKEEYNHSKSRGDDCNRIYCQIAQTHQSALFNRHKEITRIPEAEKRKLINSAPFCIHECKTMDSLAAYLLSYTRLWKRFGDMNRLLHIDKKPFICKRSRDEKCAIEKKPRCLESIQSSPKKTVRDTTLLTARPAPTQKK